LVWNGFPFEVQLLHGEIEKRQRSGQTAVAARTARPHEANSEEILAACEWQHIYWHALSRRFRVMKAGVQYGATTTLPQAIELAMRQLNVTRDELRRPDFVALEATPETIADIAGRVGLADLDAAKAWSQFLFVCRVYDCALPSDMEDLVQRRQRRPDIYEEHPVLAFIACQLKFKDCLARLCACACEMPGA
jgi:hypothetical protein